MRATIPTKTLALTLAFALLGVATASAAATSVVGHSVRGRPIVVECNGDPGAPERVLVFGAIHGNETAGMRVARRLTRAAPLADAAIWIVPTLNPDGVAAKTRGNAHGVDLNRNFPFAWKPLGGGEYSGPRPLSEPESRAARRLILKLKPDLTIWFHQPFGLVDRSGGNPAIERRFAQLSGLPLVRLTRYPGSATSWQNHTLHPATAFVVELPAVVPGVLVRRTSAAVRELASEYGSPALDPAAIAG